MKLSPIDHFQIKTRWNYENLSTQRRSADFLSLRIMRQPGEHQDPFFIYLIADKLPTGTQKFRKFSSKGKKLPTYQELKNFLEERVQALKAAAPSNSSSNTKKQLHSQQNHAQRQLHIHVMITNQQCKCCEEEHRIFKCANSKV